MEDLGAPEPGYWHAHRSDQAKQEETTQTTHSRVVWEIRSDQEY